MYDLVAAQQASFEYRRSIGFGGPAPASSISTPPKKNAPRLIGPCSMLGMVAQMPPAALTNARLADGRDVDVMIVNGRIASIDDADARRPPEDAQRLDLGGYLLLPAAVEPHAHLDKAFLAERVENPTGDLIGAIRAMQASRHLIDVQDTIERAERAARLMASNGYTAVRTHADTTVDHGLRSIEALDEVRRRVADVIDVE